MYIYIYAHTCLGYITWGVFWGVLKIGCLGCLWEADVLFVFNDFKHLIDVSRATWIYSRQYTVFSIQTVFAHVIV